MDASEKDVFATFDNKIASKRNEPVLLGDKSLNCGSNDATVFARNLRELDRKGTRKNNAGASRSEDRERRLMREDKRRKDRFMVPGDAAVVKGDKCIQAEPSFFGGSVDKKIIY